VDLAKYRALFLEEASEHLAEMSRALLSLEKNAGDSAAIDVAFRMAHSIKGMAASLEYQGIAELAHRLEDVLARQRSAGRVDGRESALLWRGLEGLERMVGAVREDGAPGETDAALLEELARPPESQAAETPPKKA
jgi:two-component system chemotaxis sensor kinase CheA